ncbi:MAG: transporter substrate-binding domain-containing protein [Prevotella sp.]|nr:transporter substrate-binding domain-containing protein [Prevotella sp.]
MNLLKRLCVLTAAAMLLTMPTTAEDIHNRYTKEHPLIYEDAWDLWPYVFQDNGKPVGYNIDLLELILKELDIPYVVKLKPTNEALEDLLEGHSDLMCGIMDRYHDNYTQLYSKTVIHLFTHSVALPKSQPNPIHSERDLASNRVIVHTGAFSHHLMEDSGWTDNAHPYNDMDNAVQLVSAEEHGIILWNTMSLKWLIHRYNANNLKLEPVNMPSGEYRFMSNDAELLEAIDKAYAKLAGEGQFTPLQNKWFYPERQNLTRMPRWVWYVIIGSIGLVLLLLAYIMLMRYRERLATRDGDIRNSRLKKILKASQVGIWLYDIHTKQLTLYNEDGSPSQQYTFDDIRRLYPVEQFDRIMAATRQVIDMKTVNAHLEVTRPDDEGKEQLTYHLIISVLRKKNERPAILIGTHRNITNMRKSQEHYKLMRSRYQAVFNNATVDMVYFDSSGFIANMNARAQRTFNMNIEEARKKHISLKQMMGIADLDFTDRDFFYATMLLDCIDERHPDGVMYYELQLVPVHDASHHLQGIYGTGYDVTFEVFAYHEMLAGLKKLQETTIEVKNYVDNMNLAMQVGGLRTLRYSPKNHELTIYNKIDQLQHTLTQERCLALIAPTSMNTVRYLLKSMDRRQDRLLNCELETIIPQKGRKPLYLQVQAYPLYDNQGRVTQYRGICRDVSEIKHTEQMLQHETARAQEIEDIKSSFLRNMCYEIRTPLYTVVGFAEQFDQNHASEDETVFIDQIKENSNYLLRLINDILFLSRLDAHMIEITPQPCDFACTFEAHCYNGWTNRQKEGVSYIVENPYNQLVVNIDDTNLGRIIEQLVNNAAEHTTVGSVRTRYEYIGGKLIITISDTGSGIPANVLSNIYERFGGNRSRNGGTGLGLPICKELAKQLGATIDISSEMGKGTSVWITLPCQATAVDRKKEI